MIAKNSIYKLPPPNFTAKYGEIKTIPPQIKEQIYNEAVLIFESSKAQITAAQFINKIIAPELIQKHGEKIIATLTKYSASGDKNSAEMKKVYTKFAQGEITHFYLTDCLPELDITTTQYLPDDKFYDKVGIDNSYTNPQESATAIARNAANIIFTFASFYATGYLYPNNSAKPLFCFRTTHYQKPHTDSITSDQSLALSLFGIAADGTVKTYFADIEMVLHFLEPEEIKLLQQKIFYLPTNSDSISPDPGSMFEILQKNKNGRWSVRFDGTQEIGGIYLHPDLDNKTAEKAQNAILKINFAVEKLLEEGKIKELGIKTGEFLVLDNRQGLHGRRDLGKANDGAENPSSIPDLKTSINSERRVMRCLTGAPLESYK